MFHSITLCLDMKGCPNRCRHCWMGWSPNGDMPEEDLAAAAEDFAPFAGNLEIHDWDREPDYSDRYRERWDLCGRLSGPKPHQPHFELASVWRLGNWKKDGARAVLDAYTAGRSTAQHTRLTVPACRLAQAHGDPDSRRLFGREDYIELLLHRYCAGAERKY